MSTITENPPTGTVGAGPGHAGRPPRRRQRLRLLTWVAAGVVVIGAMTAWGVRAHRGSPEWYPAHQVDKVDAVSFLKHSFDGLSSAALIVRVGAGDTTVNLEGAVDWSEPERRAAFRVSAGGVPTQVVVRVIGDDVWARVGTDTRWAHEVLGAQPTGQVQSAISQIASGMDLRGLFDSGRLKPSELRFKGWTIVNGEYGGVFNLTVDAAALRAAVPGLLSADDHRTRIPAQIMIDDQNRFSGFQIKTDGTSVGANVIRRNPEVKVSAPTGRTVAMSKLVPPTPAAAPAAK